MTGDLWKGVEGAKGETLGVGAPENVEGKAILDLALLGVLKMRLELAWSVCSNLLKSTYRHQLQPRLLVSRQLTGTGPHHCSVYGTARLLESLHLLVCEELQDVSSVDRAQAWSCLLR